MAPPPAQVHMSAIPRIGLTNTRREGAAFYDAFKAFKANKTTKAIEIRKAVKAIKI